MNLFDLFVKIGVDDQASSQIDTLSSKLSNGLKTAAKIGAAAVGAAATGIGALTKSAIDNYADYEQLVGGVETLFKTSADTVMGYAEQAYKTAGLSANEYMETVTSFSASLLQSLDNDTAKAAEKADLAITDMADNANKMGTSMEMIQNAYRGFAKANYTMLDNLSLGYGGTKEEMARLLQDAQKISGIQYDLSSYADIVDAIHVIQTEMGITGTTALEASETISGSISAMKSAWENFVTGLGNKDANMSELASQLMDSAKTVVKNIVPVAKNVLEAMVNTLQTDGPAMIGEALSFVMTVLPDLSSAAVALVGGLMDALIENIPMLVDAGVEIAIQLAEGLIGAIPQLVAAIPELITALVDAIIEHMPEIKAAGVEIIGALQEGFDGVGLDIDVAGVVGTLQDLLPVIAAVAAGVTALKTAMSIASVVSNVAGALDKFKKANEATTISQALLNAVMNANPIVLIITAIAALVAALVTLWMTNEDFRNAVIGAWEAVKSTVSGIVDALVGFFTGTLPEVISGFVDSVVGFFTETIPEAVGGVVDSIAGVWDAVKETVGGVVDTLVGFFTQTIPEAVSGFADSVVGFFTETIPGAISSFVESVGVFFTETIPGFLQAGEEWFAELPGKIVYWLGYLIGRFAAFGLEAIEWASEAIPELIDTVVTFFSELPEKIWEWLVETATAFGEWVEEVYEKAMEIGTTVIDTVVNFFAELPGKIWAWLVETATKFAEWVLGVQTKAVEIGTTVIDTVVNFFAELPGKIWAWLVETATKFAEWVTEIHDKAVEIGTTVIETIVNFFAELPGKIWNWLSQVIAKVQAWAINLKTRFTTAAREAINSFVTLFKELPRKMLDIGKNIIEGLWNGIKNAWGWLTDKVSGLFGNFVDGIKDGLGIHSPSKVFAEIGKFMAEGLGLGWEDEFGGIKSDMEGQMNFDVRGSQNSSAVAAGLTGLVINVTVTGNATEETGTAIGRKIANELRYRGVLSYA